MLPVVFCATTRLVVSQLTTTAINISAHLEFRMVIPLSAEVSKTDRSRPNFLAQNASDSQGISKFEASY